MAQPDLILSLFIAFGTAKIAGEIAARLKQPPVLGELLAGVMIGPYALGLIGPGPALDVLSQLGAVTLLFLVGLETRASDLKAVSAPAALVAVMGGMLPFALGFLSFLALGRAYPEALFVGAALVATSVGITARVLADMGLVDRLAARIVLAAAVIDDVLGLVVLSVAKGLTGGNLTVLGLVLLGGTVVCLLLLLARADYLTQRFERLLETMHIKEASLVFPVMLVLGLAALAEKVGLAAIIGAFLAGVFLAEGNYVEDLKDEARPIGRFLTPFFFVLMGAYVDVRVFLNPQTLALIAMLFVLAVVGKLIGGLGAIKYGPKVMLQVGVGMIPRGEVGLIVGMMGLTMKIIGPSVYTVVVSMSLLTTLIAPLLVRWVFREEVGEARGSAVSPSVQAL